MRKHVPSLLNYCIIPPNTTKPKGNGETVAKSKIALAITPYSLERCRMLTGLFEYVNRHCRWDIDLISGAEMVTRERIDQMCRDGVDGLIVSLVDRRDVLKHLESSSLRSVVIDTGLDHAPPPKANISFYDSAIAGEATGSTGFRYLRSCGNFRIYGFVANDGVASWSTNRMHGFIDEAKKGGHETSTFLATGESRLGNLKTWLRSLPKPAAVMAANDWTALETLKACRLANIEVPGQICILGVDDNELICTHSTPTLSSIRLDHAAIGAMLAKALRRMLSGRNGIAANACLSSCAATVIERGSTRPPLPAAHIIRKGLDYIEAHAAEGITVDDVVMHLGISRRLAVLRFSELNDRTISESIRQRRLEVACEKLANSNASIASVAASSGFPNLRNFEKLFKRTRGITPGEYRRQHRSTRANSQRSQ